MGLNPTLISNPKQVSKQTLSVTLPSGETTKISRASLILGESNTGKTLGAASLAEYMWHTYRKRLRLVTCEPGGYSSLQTHIDLGLIEVADIAGQRNFLNKMARLALGFWPVWRHFNDGRRVMALNDKASELTLSVLDDIGAIYFDGITSACSQIMLQTTTTGASEINIPGSPDQSRNGTMNVVSDGDLTYRFAGMGHYSFIQSRINEYVTYTCGLPYEEIWWTALPKLTEAERTGKKIYGPAISGSAAVEEALSWFGRVVHVERVVVGTYDEKRPDARTPVKGAKEEVWMWLTEHVDPATGGVYKCKMRPHIIGAKSLPSHFEVTVIRDPISGSVKSVDFFNVLFREEKRVEKMTRQYLLDTLPDIAELRTRSGRPAEMFEGSSDLTASEIRKQNP